MRIDFPLVLIYMCTPRALGFVPSAVFRLYRGDNRIQDYSTKNRHVSGLGSSFGEPQRHFVRHGPRRAHILENNHRSGDAS